MVRALEILAVLVPTLFVIRWAFNGIGAAWKAQIEARREARRQEHEREMMREARSLAILLQTAPDVANDVEDELAALRHKREAAKQPT